MVSTSYMENNPKCIEMNFDCAIINKCKNIANSEGGRTMRDIRYIISEASKRVEVEQHTLRYWEDELELQIPRNEMGHRYYREEDIEVFKAIKALKEKGYQLRAIKMLLPDIYKSFNLDSETIGDNIMPELPIQMNHIDSESRDLYMDKTSERLEQFKVIMNRLISEALENNTETLSEAVSENVTNRVIKEMDYLIRSKEEREEERFKLFDKTLREIQQGRYEYAAAKADKIKKKKGIFTKGK